MIETRELEASFFATAEFVRECTPIEFITFNVERFSEYVKTLGWEIVVGRLRILVSEEIPSDFAVNLRRVSVIATCRKIEEELK